MSDDGSSYGTNTTAGGGTAGSGTSGLGYGPSAGSGDPRGDSLDATGLDTAASDMSAGSAGDEGEGFGQAADEQGIGSAAAGVSVDQDGGGIHLAGAVANPSQDADLDNSNSDSLFSGGDGGVTPGYSSAGPARGE